MIVKVQTPLASTSKEPKALVYNEDRSLIMELDITKRLTTQMEGTAKKFFHAEVTDDAIVIGLPAPYQEW